jgi:hypothetical protein
VEHLDIDAVENVLPADKGANSARKRLQILQATRRDLDVEPASRPVTERIVIARDGTSVSHRIADRRFESMKK